MNPMRTRRGRGDPCLVPPCSVTPLVVTVADRDVYRTSAGWQELPATPKAFSVSIVAIAVGCFLHRITVDKVD